MHTHVSLIHGATAFFSVLIFGTLWRLLAAYFAKSNVPTLNHAAQGMAFQY